MGHFIYKFNLYTYIISIKTPTTFFYRVRQVVTEPHVKKLTIAMKIQKMKNHEQVLALLDNKTYYKATIIEQVWY